MGLRRIEEASVFPIGLPLVKAQCKVDANDDDEIELLTHYLATANEKIGELSGLVLGVEVWELTITDPRGPVHLSPFPVAGLVSVNGSEDLDGFSLRIDGDRATVSGDWPAGEVAIRFSAGGDVPHAIKQAMLLLVAHWFKERQTATEGELKEIPYAVESLVSDHRRGWVRG